MIVALVLFTSLVSGCLGGLNIPSQTLVTISGTVHDKTKSLEYIDVYLDDTAQRVGLTTGNNGVFSFEVPAGNYQLWAWKGSGVGKRNGAAIARQTVDAGDDVVVEGPLRITNEDLHDIHVRTHHSSGHTHIYITLEPTDFSVSYGPSVNVLREELDPEFMESGSGYPFFKAIPEEPIIGDYSFAKLTFDSDRPDIYAPVFFMELPTIISPKDNANVSVPFTIEWNEVEGASDYALYATNPDDWESYSSIFAIFDTRYEINQMLYSKPHEIWVQAFQTDAQLSLIAESMSPITVSPEGNR